ncbi:hypothetical protein [Bacillus testis]|uniref:hypothetical protein n=1 Tax=Bacillus testis TaxID=1622072 RepID=UPI00067EC5C2|nr:hypothetical protein [Bacillus testis]
MEKIKKNLVTILLSINLVVGLLAAGGVTYLIVKQNDRPDRGTQMGGKGMTPPQMNQNQNQDSSSDNTSNMQ